MHVARHMSAVHRVKKKCWEDEENNGPEANWQGEARVKSGVGTTPSKSPCPGVFAYVRGAMDNSGSDPAIAVLRERYAREEITKEEFVPS
jgi:hypothetical protein